MNTRGESRPWSCVHIASSPICGSSVVHNKKVARKENIFLQSYVLSLLIPLKGLLNKIYQRNEMELCRSGSMGHSGRWPAFAFFFFFCESNFTFVAFKKIMEI